MTSLVILVCDLSIVSMKDMDVVIQMSDEVWTETYDRRWPLIKGSMLAAIDELIHGHETKKRITTSDCVGNGDALSDIIDNTLLPTDDDIDHNITVPPTLAASVAPTPIGAVTPTIIVPATSISSSSSSSLIRSSSTGSPSYVNMASCGEVNSIPWQAIHQSISLQMLPSLLITTESDDPNTNDDIPAIEYLALSGTRIREWPGGKTNGSTWTQKSMEHSSWLRLPSPFATHNYTGRHGTSTLTLTVTLPHRPTPSD
jgi:hypothetical protein